MIDASETRAQSSGVNGAVLVPSAVAGSRPARTSRPIANASSSAAGEVTPVVAAAHASAAATSSCITDSAEWPSSSR